MTTQTIGSVIESLRQHHRRDKAPLKDGIAHPRADDLYPASPVRPAHRHKIAIILLRVRPHIHGQQRSHPHRTQKEDDVEDRVVVLGRVLLVVAGVLGLPPAAAPRRRAVIVAVAVGARVRVVERRGRKRAGLNGGLQGLRAHLAPAAGLRHGLVHAVLRARRVVLRELAVLAAAAVSVAAQRETVRRGAGGGVGHGEEGDDGAEDDAGPPRAGGAHERVAVLIVGLHAHGRKSEVGAICSDCGSLGEASARVGLLDGGGDGRARDEEQEDQIDGNRGLIHLAAVASEEYVHDSCHGEGSEIHKDCAADEEETPELGGWASAVILDLLEAVLGPVVGKVDQQDQPEKEEEHGAEESNVVAPCDEKGVGNEKGCYNQADPANQFGTPEAVLDGSATVFGASNAQKHDCQEEVEGTQSKVDTMYRNPAIAILAGAFDVNVFQGQILKLLHGPVRKHYPGEERIDEKHESIGYAGSHAVVAFATGAADCRTSRGATA